MLEVERREKKTRVDSTKLARTANEIKLKLLKYVETKYPDFYDKVKSYILTRYKKTLDLVVKMPYRIASEIIKGKGVGETDIVYSSKIVEEGKKPAHVVKVRTLSGEVVEVVEGVSLEETYYSVQVGRYGLKCTCPDSLRLSRKAQRNVEKTARKLKLKVKIDPAWFSKYCFCKHILLVASKAVTEGVLRLRDIEEPLRKAVETIVLAEHGDKLDRGTVLKILNRLKH